MAASESLPPSQVTIKMMIIVMVMAMVLEMMKMMMMVMQRSSPKTPAQENWTIAWCDENS